MEENSLIGGFGGAVLELISQEKIAARVECMGLPDLFIEHGSQEFLRSKYELDAAGVVSRIKLAYPELFSRASAGGRKQ